MTTRRRMMMAGNVSHVNADGMITDSWDTFINNIKKGKGPQYYNVGNYIPLDLGSHGVLNMEIIIFHPPWLLADRSGTPNVALFSKELMNDEVSAANGHFSEVEAYMKSVESFIPSNILQHIPQVLFPYERYGANGRLAFGTSWCKLWILNREMLNVSGQYNYSNNGMSGDTLLSFLNWSASQRIKYRADGQGPKWWFVYRASDQNRMPGYTTSIDTSGNFNYSDTSARPSSAYCPLGFCL